MLTSKGEFDVSAWAAAHIQRDIDEGWVPPEWGRRMVEMFVGKPKRKSGGGIGWGGM